MEKTQTECLGANLVPGLWPKVRSLPKCDRAQAISLLSYPHDAGLNIYNAGLIGTLRELHGQLDRAVFSAYGWPHDLTSEQIIERVVALNEARRAEEASGLLRWLRRDYQAPNYVPVTATLEGFAPEAVITSRSRQPWPANLPDQVRAIKDVMRSSAPLTPQQTASTFRPASRTRVTEILETLTALGQARVDGDRYSI